MNNNKDRKQKKKINKVKSRNFNCKITGGKALYDLLDLVFKL